MDFKRQRRVPARARKDATPEAGSQGSRFIETARTLNRDEDKAALKAKLAVIGWQKPKDNKDNPSVSRVVSTLCLCLLGYSGMASMARAAEFWTLGIGQYTCIQWDSRRENEVLGYIAGFWSALNRVAAENGRNGGVGSRTEHAAIVAEVRLKCAQNPSMPLNQAIIETYIKVREQEWGQEGR